MLDLCMNIPFGIQFICHKPFWVTLQFYIKGFRVYLIADVKNTNSSVIFWVSSVTFLK